jgi:two-component system response regulator AtoC
MIKFIDAGLDDEIFCSLWIQGFRPGGSLNLYDFNKYAKPFYDLGGKPQSIKPYVEKLMGNYSRYGMFGKTKEFEEMADNTKKAFKAKKMPVRRTGDQGTGKELVAKAIHFYGDRRNKPFAKFNVARLNGNCELFASHAFGVNRCFI